MIFQEMKLGTSVIPHFYVILTGQSISETILIIQVIFKIKKSISRSSKKIYKF